MPIIIIIAVAVIITLLIAMVFFARPRNRRFYADSKASANTRVGDAKTFAEVDGFIDMLRGACEDAEMHQTLDKILTQPDDARRQMLHVLIEDLRQKNAPRPLIDAFVCLLDDAAAEKAYAVIYACERR